MTRNYTYTLVKRDDGLERINTFRKYVIKIDGVPIAFCDWHYRPKNSGGPAWRFRYTMNGDVHSIHEHKDFKKALICFKDIIERDINAGRFPVYPEHITIKV